jgi:hypothetical protein
MQAVGTRVLRNRAALLESLTDRCTLRTRTQEEIGGKVVATRDLFLQALVLHAMVRVRSEFRFDEACGRRGAARFAAANDDAVLVDATKNDGRRNVHHVPAPVALDQARLRESTTGRRPVRADDQASKYIMNSWG